MKSRILTFSFILVPFVLFSQTYPIVTASSGEFRAGNNSEEKMILSTWSTNYQPRLTILATTGFVGIGIGDPTARLHVAGDILSSGNYNSQGVIKSAQGFFSENGVFGSTNSLFKLQSNQGFLFEPGGAVKFMVLPDGNVGIGLTQADIKQRLHVAGNIEATGNMITKVISSPADLSFSTPKGTGLLLSGASGNLNFSGGNLIVTGKIGINVTDPKGYELAVNGRIIALDLQIKKGPASSWPDYVFDPTYELPSLSSVQDFISKHKHLDGVPSTKQVAEDGYSTNEMTLALLKKVEELTLYIIQQQKEIDELEKAVKNKKD